MSHIFVLIYHFFNRINKLFLVLSSLLFAALFWIILNHFEGESNAFDLIPKSNETETYKKLFNQQSLASKLIIGIQGQGQNQSENYADSLKDFVLETFGSKLEINNQINPNQTEALIEWSNKASIFIHPAFNANDFIKDPNYFEEIKQGLSLPNAYFNRLLYKNDPLGINKEQYVNFQALRAQTFSQNNNYLYSKNDSIVVNIIEFPQAWDSKLRHKCISLLEEKTAQWSGIKSYWIGAPYISYINEKQVIKDIVLSSSIGLLVLCFLLISYYRKGLYFILLMFPVVFGVLMALGFISLFREHTSLMGIALGSIVSGLALDYSFHFFTALKHQKDLKKVLQSVSSPLILGSFTTIMAFIALMFTQNKVLQDFGLFVSLALAGTLINILVVLPQWLKIIPDAWYLSIKEREHWIDRLANASFWNKKKIIFPLLFLFIVSILFFEKPLYDGDLNHLYYQNEMIKTSEKALLPNTEFKDIYLVQEVRSFEEAIGQEHQAKEILKEHRFFGLSNYIQAPEIWKTNETVLKAIPLDSIANVNTKTAIQAGIRIPPVAYDRINNIDTLIKTLQRNQLLEGIIQEEGTVTKLIATVKWHADQMHSFPKEELEALNIKSYSNFDLKNKVDQLIQEDFGQISWLSFIFVFISLLLVYGRIELSIITLLPMISSWLMIILLSHLLNIPFNPVNIVVSAFIFGLGDDFAIFISDGLLKKYRSNNLDLKSYKSGILLSALSSMATIGALMVCEYPAMKSIGMISLLGLGIVLLNSFIIQPYVFYVFIQKRQDKGLAPYTWQAFFFTMISFPYFVIGCLIILFLSPLTYLKKGQSLWYHKMIQIYCLSIIYMNFHSKKDFRNLDLIRKGKPGIVAANHQSLLDILLALSISPKVVMMTNQWVWKSPIFGFIIQRAGFLYNEQGFDLHVEKGRQLLDQGYSIIIFPEGTRSRDGKFNRFKSGAAHLAQALGADIYPLCIHGLNYIIPKGDFMVQTGRGIAEVIPPSLFKEHQDLTPLQWTRQLQKDLQTRHLAIAKEWEKGNYFSAKVKQAFVYKGPVVEWYVKIKIMLENHFEFFKKHIPKNALVYDIGCGYGYLSYYLKLEGPERIILSSDLDQEKIKIAQNTFLSKDIQFEVKASEQLHFEVHEKPQSFILKDMLHYLSLGDQQQLINNILQVCKSGDLVIIRDSFKEDELQKKRNTWIEKISIGIGFNQINAQVHFPSKSTLLALMEKEGFSIKDHEQNQRTGNSSFIFEKN